MLESDSRRKSLPGARASVNGFNRLGTDEPQSCLCLSCIFGESGMLS